MIWLWAWFISAPLAVIASFTFDYIVDGITITETFEEVLSDDEITKNDVVIAMVIALVVPFVVWYLFLSRLIKRGEQ